MVCQELNRLLEIPALQENWFGVQFLEGFIIIFIIIIFLPNGWWHFYRLWLGTGDLDKMYLLRRRVERLSPARSQTKFHLNDHRWSLAANISFLLGASLPVSFLSAVKAVVGMSHFR